MEYTTLLAIHISGACVTGIAAIFALSALIKQKHFFHEHYAIILGVLAGFEICTGVLLSVVSPEITALSLCKNVAIYLSIVFAVETLLFFRMKGVTVFPTRLVFSPILGSLVLMGTAIVGGV